jgi:molybdopterin-containing oxidoreductase family iron-sulfur binding subunit
VVSGVSLHYATVARSAGDVLGLLVETHEGRPTKVDGNPNHPSSLGGSDGYAQASILDLYDPDRSRAPARKEGAEYVESTFAEVDAALADVAKKAAATKGKGLRVLATPSQSPTFVRVAKELLEKYPEAKVYYYEPVSAGERRAGVKAAFGQAADVAFS